MPDDAADSTTIDRPTPPARTVRPDMGQTLTGRLIDAVLDVTVLSFAFWTLLYCLGLYTQWSLWPSGLLWAAVTLVLLGWRLRSAVTADAAGENLCAVPDASSRGVRKVDLLLVPGLGLVAVAAAGGLLWRPRLFTETWLSLVLGIAVLLAWSWLSGRVRPAPDPTEDAGDAPEDDDAPAAGTRGRLRGLISLSEAGVLLVTVGIGALTSFLHLADTDDPYFLNRSVWVADRGNAALRDTMFSPETLESAYEAGLPIASIESLFGVIAHHTGLLAGTVTYLVAAPVAACLAILATWRLARAWAPRRAFLVFAGAVAFLLLSGDSMLGNFWIVRIWQGKVIALVVLMPLIWAYLVEAHEAPRRRDRWVLVGLLLSAGIAFFGLTPTAVVWAPVMLLAAVVSAVVLRSWPLAVGGVALSIGPLASGAAVKLYAVYSDDAVGGAQALLPAWDSFVRVLGQQGPMVALALLGLGLAVLLARRGAPAALAGSAAFGSVLIYAPGILPLANDLTGTGSILWRMLMVAPIPILVGLLLSAPVVSMRPSSREGKPSRDGAYSTSSPDAVRAVARPAGLGPLRIIGVAVPVVLALALVAGLAAGGRPIWKHTGHGGPVSVTERPQWKLDLEALADVRTLVREDVTGTVLLPPRQMKVLTMYSVQAFPVVARQWWIDFLEEPEEANRGRRVLYRLASGKKPLPDRESAVRAFAALEIDLACVGESPLHDRVLKYYAAADYTEESRYGTLTCVRRPG